MLVRRDCSKMRRNSWDRDCAEPTGDRVGLYLDSALRVQGALWFRSDKVCATSRNPWACYKVRHGDEPLCVQFDSHTEAMWKN